MIRMANCPCKSGETQLIFQSMALLRIVVKSSLHLDNRVKELVSYLAFNFLVLVVDVVLLILGRHYDFFIL